MKQATIILISSVLLGIYFPKTEVQALSTKCPSTDWFNYLEKCYLPVSYNHSWTTALSYCEMHGAKLAEPRGHVINDGIFNRVATFIPWNSGNNYWIGYRNVDDQGYWSDFTPAPFSAGVWGHNQPDNGYYSGPCTYISSDRKWYTSDCSTPRNYVCEIDPCPAGELDKFMCNGKCLAHSSSVLCNEIDDCGNNEDELDCPGLSSWRYDVQQGSITVPETGQEYDPMLDLTWTWTAPTGSRFYLQVKDLNTEEGIDILEVYDYSLTSGTDQLAVQLSGQLEEYHYISSLNKMRIRFISDANQQSSGFTLQWKSTGFDCPFVSQDGFSVSDSSVVYRQEKLASLQTVSECEEQCRNDGACYGFSFEKSLRKCHFINSHSLLKEDSDFTMYTCTCNSRDMNIEGSMPLMKPNPVATSVPQVLQTPMYPFPYPGNQELLYTISTPGNSLIILEVLSLELCCGDFVRIYDAEGDILAELDSEQSSSGLIILSTSNTVFVRMDLNTHWKCPGGLIKYIQGNSVSVTGSGSVASPGWDTPKSYPDLMSFTWHVNALTVERSVTVSFDRFELHETDSLTVIYPNGTMHQYREMSLQGQSVTSVEYVDLWMETSSRDNSAGFSASFSPGCPVISDAGYQFSSNSFKFGESVTLSCISGFYFTGDFVNTPSITVECESGGIWSMENIPKCAQGKCSLPLDIADGSIAQSSGSLGGDWTLYRCNQGYTMSGDANVTCLADNTWQALPTCISEECLDINTFVSADVNSQVLFGDGIKHGSVVELSCGENKEIIGLPRVQCLDGLWDFEMLGEHIPSCVPIQCETPVIGNAELSPGGPYVIDQPITAACVDGFMLQGSSTFNCGSQELPTCYSVECSLDPDTFPHVIPADDPDRRIFPYGYSVNVTCEYSYYLADISTCNMTITCEASGTFSNIPICAKQSCATPAAVAGSVYSPAAPCLEHNCSFTFGCRNGYELVGESRRGNIVTCGFVYDGLWNFGNLTCEGGQCEDPNHPADAKTIGETYEQFAHIFFECINDGHEALNPDKTKNEGWTCEYNEVTQRLEWVGIVPVCNDTQKPIFSFCQDNSFRIEATHLKSLPILEPTVSDNGYITSKSVNPPGFRPSHPVNEALNVFYIAEDEAGQTAMCQINIKIPNAIACLNNIASSVLLSGNMTIRGNDSTYLRVRNSTALITTTPEHINVTANAATLKQFYVIAVEARDPVSKELINNCTLQFKFQSAACALWAIDAPNAVEDCHGSSCTITCKPGYLFMHDPNLSEVHMHCDANGWNTTTPVCASNTTNYVIYTARYSFYYTLATELSQPYDDCEASYKNIILPKLQEYKDDMEEKCNSDNSVNPAILTVLESTVTVEYRITRVEVTFELLFELTDDSVVNAAAIKDICSARIATELRQAQQSGSISNLESTSDDCSNGFFIPPASTESGSGSAVNQYKCQGYRRFAYKNGQRLCLDCPIGYYYEYNSGDLTHNCYECPNGTYGDTSPDGVQCVPCATGRNSGLTGLTDPSFCNSYKEHCKRGHYSSNSTDGLAPCKPCPKNFYAATDHSSTCNQCPSNMFTLQEGCVSFSQCETQEDVADMDVTHPCRPNPCQNGGVCEIVRGDFYCNCPPGYTDETFTGGTCLQTVDACSNKPCKNGQACSLDPTQLGGFICECNLPVTGPPEFSGTLCEIDDLGCSPTFCQNNGTCHNEKGSHACKCPSYSGFRNGNAGQCEEPIDPCEVEPCINGGCISHGTHKSCNCYNGWTGPLCETNIDDCETSLCENGATCIDGINMFTCRCAAGYHGYHCQYENSCLRACVDAVDTNCHRCTGGNIGSCIPVTDGYICNCLSTYTGTFCELEISPCNSYPCQHGGTCIEDNGDYMCNCTEPWIGELCTELEDNCPDSRDCYNGGTCWGTPYSFACECPFNYIGEDCGMDYNLCDIASPCVAAHGTCTNTETGGSQCSCIAGWEGDYCETASPTCTDDICLNGGTCINIEDPNPCVCAPGYTGSHCQTNIDECQSNPCLDNKVCVDGDNSYTCKCAAGMQGINCDKVIGADLDFLVTPRLMCREEVSRAIFGDGSPIIELTIAFWARVTAPIDDNQPFLSVYGSNILGATVIPESPSFFWKVYSSYIETYLAPVGLSRKKRETVAINYPSIDDGRWHHIAITWSDNPGEITIYVDGSPFQRVFSEGSALALSGFLVLGDFDTVTGTSIPGFTGRISRLYVLNSRLGQDQVTKLYARSWLPSNEMFYEAENMMLLHPVDYQTELQLGNEKCLPGDGSDCPDISSGVNIQEVTDCPSDTFVITERGETPTWTNPSFDGPYSSNIIDLGLALYTWGVHGVIYSYTNGEGHAAVCSFRLFNGEVGCIGIVGSEFECTITDSETNCEDTCPEGKALPGSTARNQTCSLYGMWDEPVKHSPFIYPVCSDEINLQKSVTLSLVANTKDGICNEATIVDYKESVGIALQELHDMQTSGQQLCPADDCTGLIDASSFICDGSNVKVDINFGTLSSTFRYVEDSFPPESVSIEVLFKLMVGDRDVFTYMDPNNAARVVSPNLASVSMIYSSVCPDGYMISGDKCVQCGQGTHYNVTTKLCVRCPKGTYRSDILDPVSQCTACEVSHTTLTDGATDQSYCVASCLPGYSYQILPNRPGGCVFCPVGFYQDVAGKPNCKPCQPDLTTAEPGASNEAACVTPASLTTTATALPVGPTAGAVTEDTGLSIGVIVAIVLAILLVLLILILIVCFCCCKDKLPCLSKKKQVVSPMTKDGYYAKKYGDPTMQFVSYNLKDIREKKGKPLDRVPFVEPPLSDETGSVKTDLSVHVPVFNEKMNGKVTRKSLYMSNGGHSLNTSVSRSARTPRDPMTSSPRDAPYYEDMDADTYRSRSVKPKRRRKKRHGERSSSEHTPRHERYEDYDTRGQLPKTLSPMPIRLKSTPPDQVILRPSSPLQQARVRVEPSQYEDFLEASPSRQIVHIRSPQPLAHHDRDRSHDRGRSYEHERSLDHERSLNRERSHDGERSHDHRRSHDVERSHDHERSHDKKRGRKHRKHRSYDADLESGREQEVHNYVESHMAQDKPVYRIEVESDEDLR